jgi:hypothetical protein
MSPETSDCEQEAHQILVEYFGKADMGATLIAHAPLPINVFRFCRSYRL